MRRWLAPLWGLGLLLALPAGAAPGPVAVDVSTVSGVRLGRLVGELQGSATYFLLADVARLARARTRQSPDGDRISLVTRHGMIRLARDAPRITVDGEPVTLGAPVRVRRGTWRVPGDLLVRGLPGLLGIGVRVTSAEAGTPRTVSPGGVSRPRGPRSRAPRARWPCRPSRPRVRIRLRGCPRPWRRSPKSEPAEPARSRARAPSRARPRGASERARVELRVRSYPTYTRLVLEADAPIEPRLVETEGGLTVAFPEVSPRGWTGTEHGARRPRGDRRAGRGAWRRGPPGGLRAPARGAQGLPAGGSTAGGPRLPPPGAPRARGGAARRAGAAAGTAQARSWSTRATGGTTPAPWARAGSRRRSSRSTSPVASPRCSRRSSGVRVVLTRARDQFVGLRERTALANRERADLFLSIHVNAAPAGAATRDRDVLPVQRGDGRRGPAGGGVREPADRDGYGAAERRAGGGALHPLGSRPVGLPAGVEPRGGGAAEPSRPRASAPQPGSQAGPLLCAGRRRDAGRPRRDRLHLEPPEEQRLRDDGYRDRIARALVAGVAAYKRSYDQRVTGMAQPMTRHDGRAPGDLRPVRLTRRYTRHAEGAVLVEVGDTRVICTASVEDRVPPFLRGSGQGWVTAEYGMLPRATSTRTGREAGRTGGRTHEIQRLVGRSLRAVMQLAPARRAHDHRRLRRDPGRRRHPHGRDHGRLRGPRRRRPAAPRGRRLLAEPLRDLVAATSVGIVLGTPVVDLDYQEDSTAEVDMNVVMTGAERFVEVQGTAERTRLRPGPARHAPRARPPGRGAPSRLPAAGARRPDDQPSSRCRDGAARPGPGRGPRAG